MCSEYGLRLCAIHESTGGREAPQCVCLGPCSFVCGLVCWFYTWSVLVFVWFGLRRGNHMPAHLGHANYSAAHTSYPGSAKHKLLHVQRTDAPSSIMTGIPPEKPFARCSMQKHNHKQPELGTASIVQNCTPDFRNKRQTALTAAERPSTKVKQA